MNPEPLTSDPFSATTYLVGVAGLTLGVAALGLVAVLARRRLIGHTDPALARVCEVTLAAGWLVAVSAVLGSVGGFRGPLLLMALVASATGAWWLDRRLPAADGEATATDPGPAPPATSEDPRWLTVASLAIAGVVVARWGIQAVASLRRGIYDGDTLWYHATFAARFAQDGWVTRIPYVSPEPLVSFFPANSELIHAAAILPFGTEVLTPLINLGWLGLGLGAGWVLGATSGRPAVGLAGAAAALAVPVMVLTQAGTARNDAMGVALVLIAVAVATRVRTPGGAAVAGVALGLAAGVKLSIVIPGAIVGVGILGTIWLGRRWASPGRATVALATPAAVLGSFWYLRNWARVGNPLPWVDISIGPVDVAAVPLPQASVGDSALIDRLGETGLWADLVRPGFTQALGALWPVLLIATVVAVVAVALRPAHPGARVLAITTAVIGVAYIFTPNSAPEAVTTPLSGLIFGLNTRYLVPALALGLVLVAASRTRALATAVAVGALSVTVIGLVPGDLADNAEWRSTAGDVVIAGLVVVVAVAGGWALARLPAGQPRWLSAAGAAVLVAAVGFGVLDSYLADRWPRPAPYATSQLWSFGGEVTGARIGLVGDFFGYPYHGPGLGNEVRYIGVRGPDGGFGDATTCQGWRRALRAAEVDYVVVAPPILDLRPPGPGPDAWTRSGETEVVARSGPSTVYRLTGEPDPAGCD